ncbi:MAG: DUF4097 family beta strand repeat-containing protein [Acidobacteriota bacterium]
MKNLRTRKAALAGISFLFVFSFALARERYEEKFEKTAGLAKGGKVDVNNISGDILVAVWSQDQVKIEAFKISKASSLEKAKENAARVTIEVVEEGTVLRIETKYPRSEGFWGRGSVDVSVDYKLWIPEWAGLKADNISGNITAEAIGGTADLSAISGNVTLKKAARGAECSTISGDLEVIEVVGDVFLKSVSGNVTARMIKGSLQAKTVSGDLELLDVSDAGRVEVEALSGEVVFRGRLNRQGTYRIKSHSGDVEMWLPADSAFDFEAETFSGGIETDFEIKVIGRISPKEMTGVVNGGGATVKLSSFSGDVRLKKAD